MMTGAAIDVEMIVSPSVFLVAVRSLFVGFPVRPYMPHQ